MRRSPSRRGSGSSGALPERELERLEELVFGRVCVVGIGNRLAHDDGAGCAVAERLAGRVAGRVIDAGVAPENHLEPIVRAEPDTILLVDAVDFGGEPGGVRVLDPKETAAGGLSTHATSLGMVREYLSARSEARVLLVGIQPGRLGLGGGLSPEVARSVEAVVRRVVDLLGPVEPNETAAAAVRSARPGEAPR